MSFENADTSDDKCLNLEEFLTFCRHIGLSETNAIVVLFEGIDSDYSKTISLFEFT